ncbi:MAG: amino acid adenylation domain-containing protein [Pseudomonadota bacterium]
MDQNNYTSKLRLSPAQEGILFHSLYEANPEVYFEQRWCCFSGKLNSELFKQAWLHTINRHSALRTSFDWLVSHEPKQIIHSYVDLPWSESDWSNLSEDEHKCQFDNWLLQDRLTGFDLDAAPLMRCALIKIDQSRFYFIWSYHHITMDGWCNALLIKEVLESYQHLLLGKEPRLAKVGQYSDYLKWLDQIDEDKYKQYWQDHLINAQAVNRLQLPNLYIGETVTINESRTRKGEIKFILDDELYSSLIQFSHAHHITLNNIIQSVWALALGYLQGSQEIIYASVFANRPPEISGIENIIGMFMSTVPVRVRWDAHENVIQWLQELQTQQRTHEQYSYCGLRSIQDWSSDFMEADVSSLDALFVFENYPLSGIAALNSSLTSEDNLKIEHTDGFEQSHYPLALMVSPEYNKQGIQQLSLCYRFNETRFDPLEIHSLYDLMRDLLERLVLSPSSHKMTLSDLMSVDEKSQKKLNEFSAGPVCDLDKLSVFEIINQQCKQCEQCPSISFYGSRGNIEESLNYAQLKQCVENYACHFTNYKIGHNKRVGVYVERNVNLPAVLLSIWKLGAVYVPLDPDLPNERLIYIIQQAELEVIVSSNRTLSSTIQDLITSENISVICLEQLSNEPISQAIADHQIQESDLAYIIYTSGTTGKPKGVAVTHENVKNFLSSVACSPGLNSDDTFLALTTISFDISVLEIFLPLFVGARLILADSMIAKDANLLATLLTDENVSAVQATPSTWRLLKEENWKGKESLKILCGAEALEAPLASWLLSRCDELWNMYGPTETTVWSGALKLTQQHIDSKSIPVGGPLNNTRFWVLDQNQQLVSPGIPGELYIGGKGLTQGYWRQDDLTNKVFINVPDDFGLNQLYRTGDLVRWRNDGALDYLGRLDNQVKIRGFRIELMEIEQVLMKHASVKQAIVNVQQEADSQHLVAYLLLSEAKSEILVNQLKDYMSLYLPIYMHPSFWRILESIPRLPNGKINYQALAHSGKRIEDTSNKSVSLTDFEQLVANIWSSVLPTDAALSKHDNFFELGGHSLLATRICGQLQKILNKTVSVRLIFENPKLSDFCEKLINVSNDESIIRAKDLPSITPTNDLQLSWPQRRQYLLQKIQPENNAYHIPIALHLTGTLEIKAIEYALDTLIKHYQVLRAGFIEERGQINVFIKDALSAKQMLDYSQTLTTDDNLVQQARDTIDQLLNIPFNLAQPPLFRIRVIQGINEHAVVLDIHHILVDEWSIALIMRKFIQAYDEYLTHSQDTSANSSELIDYYDYVGWSHNLDHDQDLSYWKKQLANYPEKLNLPYSNAQNSKHTPSNDVNNRIPIILNEDLYRQLNKFSVDNGLTLYMTLLMGLFILMSRYTRQDDIVIATPVANREHPDSQHIVGLLMNTLLLRLDLSQCIQLSEVIQSIRSLCLDAFQHQRTPLESVLHAQPELRQLNTEPANILFSLQAEDLNTLKLKDMKWSQLDISKQEAKFDLNIVLRHDKNNQGDMTIKGYLEFRSELFEHSLIKQMVRHYMNMLSNFSANSGSVYRSWPLLSTNEIDWLKRTSVSQNVECRHSVHEIFRSCSEKFSQSIAIVDDNTQITFQELEQQSNRLANLLQALKLTPEMPIGFKADRSWQSCVFMLGILKAGACYVPLESKLPSARLNEIVQHANLSIILIKSASEKLDIKSDAVQLPYDLLLKELDQHSSICPPCKTTPEQLAYVMYTSGSTGIPKAVSVTHAGIVRLVNQCSYVELSQQTVMLHAASLAFDAATFEIWGALLNGGKLIICSEEQSDLSVISQLIKECHINTAWLTAGLFQLMVDEQIGALKNLNYLLAGGDVLSMHHLKKMKSFAPDTVLINGYGPTEATTFTACHEISQKDTESISIPIGKPIANTYLYVLDHHMQLIPPGVIGELYIGGEGLARGYYRQPELTATQFIPNPLMTFNELVENEHKQVIYKSGDLVRINSDGVFEFHGREDDQVKLRGFRIECREIENTLLTHPDVSRAFVSTYSKNSKKNLTVWYMLSSNEHHNECQQELYQLIKTNYPDYMMPAFWVNVTEWPLNINGKLDVSKLPPPVITQTDSPITDIDHLDEMEALLLSLWSAILSIDIHSIDDNYFSLGGDSILAMQLVHRANNLGIALYTSDIFNFPTIRSLSNHLKSNSYNSDKEWQLPDQDPKGEVRLSPIQQWFFDLQLPQPNHFNQSVALTLYEKVALSDIKKMLSVIIERHDAFRLRFIRDDKNKTWKAFYQEGNANFTIHKYDICDEAIRKQQINDLHDSIDISKGPLFSIAVYPGNNQFTLVWVIHHLIIDGVSWRILMQDLITLWERYKAKLSLELGPKPFSYQQYSESIHTYVPNHQVIRDWLKLSDASINSSSSQTNKTNETLYLERNVSVQNDVIDLSNIFMNQEGLGSINQDIGAILLTALSKSLCLSYECKEILIETETHGRQISEQLKIELSQTLGWFTGISPILLKMPIDDKNQTFLSHLNDIKEQIKIIQNVSYSDLYYTDHLSQNKPQSNIIVNYLGALGLPNELAGIAKLETGLGQLSHPDNYRTHAMHITAWIESQLLNIEWRYDEEFIESEKLAGLSLETGNALKEILSIVFDKEDGSQDLSTKDLSETEVKSALSQIDFN